MFRRKYCLATGGGAVVREENRRILSDFGYVVFLAVQSSSFCHELNMTKADHFCSVPIEQKLSLAFCLNGLPITQGWRI